MNNFQGALKQKGDDFSGLWADERVYLIAKEIQLLKLKGFGNIFLGLCGVAIAVIFVWEHTCF